MLVSYALFFSKYSLSPVDAFCAFDNCRSVEIENIDRVFAELRPNLANAVITIHRQNIIGNGDMLPDFNQISFRSRDIRTGVTVFTDLDARFPVYFSNDDFSGRTRSSASMIAFFIPSKSLISFLSLRQIIGYFPPRISALISSVGSSKLTDIHRS